jgi:hypothetical protein
MAAIIIGGPNIKRVLLAVLLAAVSTQAFAATARDANGLTARITNAVMLPDCRLFAEGSSYPHTILQGYCAGLVEGIAYTANSVCIPAGANNNQLVRVVVQYIDSYPARLNEDFRALALEALFKAWPCKPPRP